jgi:hypothetical protein
MNLEE